VTQPALARRLRLADAVVIGLGAMIGAGVFAVFAPAAQAAGAALLIGLGIAALVAYCNATSSAQLAATYPTSGGTYIYGRERLGPWWGYLAGWGFVVGKIASCAAMALTVVAYLFPSAWQRPLAIGTVAVMTGITCLGVTRTARVTALLVSVVLATLVLAVVAAWAGGQPDIARWHPATAGQGWYGVVQSAGLIFFAYAGYARIATLGEEVRNPRRVIPRAILIALLIAVVVYAAVAMTTLATLGPQRLAASSAPVADAVAAGSWSWAVPVVRVGAVAASLGSLLALIAGIGRTTLAMARHADLPGWLAVVHPTHRIPRRAQVTVGLLVCVLVAFTDLRGAIAFSSFGVLIYYLIANLAAFTQTGHDRRYPRTVQVAGMIGCAGLAVTLPVAGIVAGLAIFAIGVVVRLVRLRTRA
jgi:basic amino acid/polyamine antiporter, APA family